MAEELQGNPPNTAIDPTTAAQFAEPPPAAPPPAPASAPAPAPTTTPFQIGEQEFQLPADLADALRSELPAVQELQDQLRQSTTELDQMRTILTRLQGVFQPEAPAQPDFSTQLLTDPANAKQTLVREIVTALSARDTAKQQKETFWTTFVTEHEDLKGFEDLAQSVMADHPDLYQAANTEENRKKLAELTRTKALGIAERFGQGRTTNLRVVEGGGRARQAAPAVTESEPQNPTSIGELIRQRRAARRKAAQ